MPFKLYTCLLEVPNLMNQCPIGHILNDPDDGSYVCLNDMLLEQCLMCHKALLRKLTIHMEFVQKIVDSF